MGIAQEFHKGDKIEVPGRGKGIVTDIKYITEGTEQIRTNCSVSTIVTYYEVRLDSGSTTLVKKG